MRSEEQQFILNRKQTFPGLLCKCVSFVVALVPQFTCEQPLCVKLRLSRQSYSRLNRVYSRDRSGVLTTCLLSPDLVSVRDAENHFALSQMVRFLG